MSRLRRALAVVAGTVLVAVLLVSGQLAAERVPAARAANAADFTPGMLITDELFFDGTAMTAAEVQAFLNDKGRGCGSNCLKNYAQATRSMPATSRCAAYTGRSRETAAEIIANVGRACGISPKALLVMLEKETSLVTMNGPGDWRYERAMGYYCPDDPSRPGWCHPDYGGFFNQVYNAAAQMQRYVQNPDDYGYRAGRWNDILYNPDRACGTQRVYIENTATAVLYIYTPYVPNRAALNNLYGTGDGCSAYGNRNFWRLYTDWFGSTTSTGSSKHNPYGRLEAGTGGADYVEVSGWGIDPDDMKQPLYVWVTIDGVGQHILGNKPRTDLPRVLPGAGPSQGFSARLSAAPGKREVCVTLANIGLGSHTPLGCRTVEVTTAATAVDPIGELESVAAGANTITVRGWAFEPDNLATSAYVYVSIDGVGSHIRADRRRDDIARAHPEAGAYRGFEAAFSASPGAHRVCVSLHNTGRGSHVQLGCRSVQVQVAANVLPRGHLDAVVPTRGGVQVSGWAFDADTPASARVEIKVDGQMKATVSTGTSRPDVARVVDPRAGNAGFSTVVSVGGGSHVVCADAIDSGTSRRVPLGCSTVTVPSGSPIGSLEAVRRTSGGVQLAGWAADPDRPDGPIYMWVTVNGRGHHVLANLYRPDVPRTHPMLSDRHGFWIDLQLPRGSSTVCLTASNVGPGSHVSFGCHVVSR